MRDNDSESDFQARAEQIFFGNKRNMDQTGTPKKARRVLVSVLATTLQELLCLSQHG